MNRANAASASGTDVIQAKDVFSSSIGEPKWFRYDLVSDVIVAIRSYIYMYVYIYIFIFICTYTYINISISLSIYRERDIYVYIYIYIYMYIYMN